MRYIKVLAGPVGGFIVGYLLHMAGNAPVVCNTAGVMILMAVWWMTEAMNIYFTSLLPLIFFPVLGILGMDKTAQQYMNDVVFLFIGGYILAFALERWNLHKRVALKIILTFGTSPSQLLFGFLFSSYFISMWITNTATTLMMLPAAFAVVKQLHGGDDTKRSGLGSAIFLAIAYGATIGGTATLVGTVPNLVLKKFYDQSFPTSPPLDFASWMLFGVPMSLLLLTAAFFVFKIFFLKKNDHEKLSVDYCKNEYKSLGKMSFEEICISVVFLSGVILWFTMDDKQFGAYNFTGWKNYFPQPTYIKESYVAMFMAAVLFLIPSKKHKHEGIVTWNEIKRVPIGIIFLFGGGFALAEGVQSSGLSQWIADNLVFVNELPVWLMILVLCLITTLFSEFASNTATVTLFLTILIPIISAGSQAPLLLMLPVTMAASYSFMLPVGTPPNTIVFGSEQVSAKQMMRVGLWLDLIGALIITGCMLTLGKWVFGI